MPHGLDDIDRTILYYLSQDARHNSAADIAEHVRVSAQTVRNRINQLENDGVIEGYHPQIDFERAAGYITNLFICTTGVEDRARHAHQAAQIPGVINIREIMTGKADLRIIAVGNDTDEITQIARAISDLGINIERGELIRREHSIPFRQYSPEEGLEGPTITDFLNLKGESEVVEVTVDEKTPIVGKTLRDATQEGILADDVLVASIERDDATLTPQGDTTVEVGDVITILSRRGFDEKLTAIFSNPPEGSN